VARSDRPLFSLSERLHGDQSLLFTVYTVDLAALWSKIMVSSPPLYAHDTKTYTAPALQCHLERICRLLRCFAKILQHSAICSFTVFQTLVVALVLSKLDHGNATLAVLPAS